MKDAVYARNVAARAFDVVRYVLPLAVPTNVGQVVSIRTLEKQIGHLLAAPYAEVRQVGELLKAACGEPPLDLWGELGGAGGAMRSVGADADPPRARQPVLADAYARSKTSRPRTLQLGAPAPAELVELVPEHPLEVEIAATLLYRVSAYPYRQIVEAVSGWSEARRGTVIDAALAGRSREELLPELQSGYGLVFDVAHGRRWLA